MTFDEVLEHRSSIQSASHLLPRPGQGEGRGEGRQYAAGSLPPHPRPLPHRGRGDSCGRRQEFSTGVLDQVIDMLQRRGRVSYRALKRQQEGMSMVEEVDFVEDMDRDDTWLKAHLEEIVERYAHKVIAILDQQIVGVGTSIEELQRTVTAQYPQRVPLVFEVPRREEFECLL